MIDEMPPDLPLVLDPVVQRCNHTLIPCLEPSHYQMFSLAALLLPHRNASISLLACARRSLLFNPPHLALSHLVALNH